MSDPIVTVPIQGEPLDLYETSAATASGRMEILAGCRHALNARNATGYSRVTLSRRDQGPWRVAATTHGRGYPGHEPVENWVAWSNEAWVAELEEERLGYREARGVVLVMPIGQKAATTLFPHAEIDGDDDLFYTYWAWRPFLNAGVRGLETSRINIRALWHAEEGQPERFLAAAVESTSGMHPMPADGKLGIFEESTALALVAGREQFGATTTVIRSQLGELLDSFEPIERALVDKLVGGGLPLASLSGSRIVMMQQQFLTGDGHVLVGDPRAHPFPVLAPPGHPVHVVAETIYAKSRAQGADAVVYAVTGPCTLGNPDAPLLEATEDHLVAAWVGRDTPIVLVRSDGEQDAFYAIVDDQLVDLGESE